ncbi:hypothetical protein [Streptomyces niveus]|uniref:hypothetical protein n=1 Tax=Streptomyces niveus TaxID=193462 RepID=UPI0036D36AB8
MARERIRWPAVVDRAREIVESYEGGVTLRQVMYRLASAGVLPHTPSMYRHLSAHLAKARREDRFPDLIDTLREVHVPPSWPDAGSFLRESPAWFGLDLTHGQAQALYVAAEKDTSASSSPAGSRRTASRSWWSAASARSPTSTSSATASPPTRGTRCC